jgi:hypothetical protein
MLQLARVITLGALNRDESRGAHYKPEFPKRNDEEWLKTTIAEFSDESPVFSYEDVDVSQIEPRQRDYSSGKKAKSASVIGEGKEEAAEIPYEGHEMKPADENRAKIIQEDGEKIKNHESFQEEHEDLKG